MSEPISSSGQNEEIKRQAYLRLNKAGRAWGISFDIGDQLDFKYGLLHIYVKGRVPNGKRAAFSEILTDVEEQLSKKFRIETLFVVVSSLSRGAMLSQHMKLHNPDFPDFPDLPDKS